MESEFLPAFWQFLKPGWWILHILAVGIIYLGGIAHGRRRALRPPARREKADPPTT